MIMSVGELPNFSGASSWLIDKQKLPQITVPLTGMLQTQHSAVIQVQGTCTYDGTLELLSHILTHTRNHRA